MRRSTVAVIGAGPGGLAAAAALRRKHVSALVLEQGPRVGTSWQTVYDRLRLHTSRRLSGLPGLAIPRDGGPWVARDDVISYLESYADHHRLEILFNTHVERIDRGDGQWVVRTTRDEHEVDAVVVATGHNREPFLPAWEGLDRYRRELVHSSAYRNPARYACKDVLVVGAGNSGTEIAFDLAQGGARSVFLSVRTPPQMFPRSLLGIPAQAAGICIRRLPPHIGDAPVALLQRAFIGDLSRHGMPRPSHRPYTDLVRRQAVPVLDVGLIDLLKRRRVEIVAGVRTFAESSVVLVDETRLAPEAVIAATGYRCGLEPLVGHLGVLTPSGRPSVHGAKTHPNAVGVYFTGFTTPISGQLRELGIDARKIAKAISETSPWAERV